MGIYSRDNIVFPVKFSGLEFGPQDPHAWLCNPISMGKFNRTILGKPLVLLNLNFFVCKWRFC